MLQKKVKIYLNIFKNIKSSNNIALVSHINPDLDTICSTLAFYEIIKIYFPFKKVNLVCFSKLSEKYKKLKFTEEFLENFKFEDYDLSVFFDCSSRKQTGFLKYNYKNFNTISIDHHTGNELFAKKNIVNETYSSTTMIIFEIFYLLRINFSKNIATNLLIGIYSDTGGLKHSNTNKVTYFIISKLLQIGADKESMINNFFTKKNLSKIKLWGKILSNTVISHDLVLFSYVNKTLLDSYNCNYEDISGVIDYLNTVSGIKYTTLLTKKGDFTRVSLRTLRDDIDLSQIAKKFNGGGHKKASGFII